MPDVIIYALSDIAREVLPLWGEDPNNKKRLKQFVKYLRQEIEAKPTPRLKAIKSASRWLVEPDEAQRWIELHRTGKRRKGQAK